MLNFKLISFHLKQCWIILATIIIAAITLILVSVIGGQTLSPLSHHSGNWDSTTQGIGSLFAPMVIGGTMALSLMMAIILLFKLFVKEIDRSYIATWLTLPMSRQKVITSKLVVIMLAITLFHTISTSFQLIIYGSLMKDFTANIAFVLVGMNFSMLFTSLLFMSLAWILITMIDKHIIALTIASVFAALSIIFFIIATGNPDASNPFHVLKYVTILIFVQSPLNFDYSHPIKDPITDSEWWQYYPVLFSSKNLAWQIPVPLLTCLLPLALGTITLKNKNLSI